MSKLHGTLRFSVRHSLAMPAVSIGLCTGYWAKVLDSRFLQRSGQDNTIGCAGSRIAKSAF